MAWFSIALCFVVLICVVFVWFVLICVVFVCLPTFPILFLLSYVDHGNIHLSLLFLSLISYDVVLLKYYNILFNFASFTFFEDLLSINCNSICYKFVELIVS